MKNPGLLWFLVLLAAGSVVPASAAVLKPSFGPVVQYPAGFYDSTGALVTDVNHDGKMDIVVTSLCGDDFCTATGTVNVLLGNGDGTFQTPVTYASGGIFALALTSADVNHDGNLDLLVVNQCPTGLTVMCGAVTTGSGTVGVLLGNGDGTFRAAVPYSTGGLNPASIAVGDVNKDGKMDVLVANMCGVAGCASSGLGEAGVLLGNGDGTFRAPVEYPTGGYGAVSIAVADLDADGKLDLAVANSCIDAGCSSSGVGSLLGNGDGTFRAATSYPSGSFGAHALVVADFNRDGKFDVAVAHNDYPGAGVVGLLLGNGNGTFQAPAPSTSGGITALSMAVGDFNGDGNPDLAIYNGCGGSACNNSAIGVLSGRGDGTFRTDVFHPGGRPTSSGPNIVAVGDVTEMASRTSSWRTIPRPVRQACSSTPSPG